VGDATMCRYHPRNGNDTQTRGNACPTELSCGRSCGKYRDFCLIFFSTFSNFNFALVRALSDALLRGLRQAPPFHGETHHG